MTVINAEEQFKSFKRDVKENRIWFNELEHLAVTPGALDLLEQKYSKEPSSDTLSRQGHHIESLCLSMARGFFGNVDEDSMRQILASIKDGGMVMGVYDGLWVIVDPGHKVMTILLPSDY